MGDIIEETVKESRGYAHADGFVNGIRVVLQQELIQGQWRLMATTETGTRKTEIYKTEADIHERFDELVEEYELEINANTR